MQRYNNPTQRCGLAWDCLLISFNKSDYVGLNEVLLGELAQVHPITRALSGTPPRTRRVAGEIVALGVLATLEARMGFEEKGERA